MSDETCGLRSDFGKVCRRPSGHMDRAVSFHEFRREWPGATPAEDIIRALIEAGEDIHCYPEGAVGLEEWSDEERAAKMWLDSREALG